ncbi:hypothetical protein ACF08M_29425 [Streptomyces sp. NPDC015032]|uniref:hypothetical protein n=1 Tax=Streptomyces sp. NPDC015032 TaxID=3364937 RepID=UPI0036F5A349
MMDGRVRLPQIGAVLAGDSPSLPWVVVDGARQETVPVSDYLLDRMLGDVSPLTCRSHAYDLPRWYRAPWAVDVGWERATESETAVPVGWLRSARNPQRERKRGAYQPGTVNAIMGKPALRSGYAPASIAHKLSVLHGFYAFHLHYGRGPVANPVPANPARRAALAHRSPVEERVRYRRGRMRPKIPARQPRAIPDDQWNALFQQMRCTRDRALLACSISSACRASELLGVQLGDTE